MTQNNHRQLIITADDCGLSEGINQAAYDLYQRGLLTTATMMMNFSAIDHALRLFRQAPRLNLGVHLNLTDGYPLTDIPPQAGLTQADGRFQPRTVLFTRSVFPSDIWLQAAEAEMNAQVESFIQHMGYPPQHLTTHMHFHILPALRYIVLDLADHYAIQWVRAFETTSTVIPYNFFVQQPAELFRPDNLKITPDYIASVQAWMNFQPDQLVKTMMGLNGLIELVVHPSLDEDTTYPAEMAYKPLARAKEMAFLLQLAEAMQPHTSAFEIRDPSQKVGGA